MATERTVLVRLKGTSTDLNAALARAKAGVRDLRNEIDTTNDRTAWLAQSILALGPAAVPIGAAAIPVIMGLAAQMTVAAIAAGTLGLAFNGVGDGLKALNDYQLAPTAENMTKLDLAMEKLGPDGEQFVRFLEEAGHQFSELGMTSRAGAFPGMEEGITHLMTMLPQFNRIVGNVSKGIGELSAEAGEGLSSDKFAGFFDYIESDAKPIMMDMGHTVGFLVEGFANLMVAFGPQTREFSSALSEGAEGFAKWSRSLDENDSFQSFLEYLDEAGPRAADFFGSLIDAMVALLHASAPVGEILLPAFSTLLDLIGNIAQTPIGPVFIAAAAAMSLYGRAAALASITTGGLGGKLFGITRAVDDQGKVIRTQIPSLRTWGNALANAIHPRDLLANPKAYGRAGEHFKQTGAAALAARDQVKAYGRENAATAAQVALLAFTASGAAESMGLTNAATGALIGTMLAPGVGTAVGAVAGGLLDIRAAGDGVVDVMEAMKKAQEEQNWDRLKGQIADAKKELEDLQNFDGVGDTAGDVVKSIGAAFQGKGLGFGLANDLSGDIREAQSALDKGIETAAARRQLDLLVGGFQSTGAGARYAGMSVEQFQAHIESLNRALEGRASLRDYEAALDDFRKSLRKNGNTMDINTAKGRENQAALDNIASTALKVVKNMKQTDKIRVLSAARQDFIKAAMAGDMSRRAAERLANKVLGLNSIKGEPKIRQRGAEQSEREISRLRATINSLRDKTVYVTTVRRNRGASGTVGQGGAADALRLGGPVVAQHGMSRGPYDDSIPIMASHNEYMMRVAAHQKYGTRFMDDVNSGRFPIPPGYREGGAIQFGGRVNVAAPNVQTGDTYVRIALDGNEFTGVIDARIDQRADVSGSYTRAARSADE